MLQREDPKGAAVDAERLEEFGGDIDDAALVILRCPELAAHQGPLNRQGGCVFVEIAPVERQQLGEAEARPQAAQHEGRPAGELRAGEYPAASVSWTTKPICSTSLPVSAS